MNHWKTNMWVKSPDKFNTKTKTPDVRARVRKFVARLEVYTIVNEEVEIFKKSLLFLMIPLPAVLYVLTQ